MWSSLNNFIIDGLDNNSYGTANQGFSNHPDAVQEFKVQNQFGGTFGGPIISDKTFFFPDYEGFRRITSSLVFAAVTGE